MFLNKIIKFLSNISGNKKKRSIPTSPFSKRAICIGINDYSGTNNDLNGCVNDAKRWHDILNKFYGFNKITTILDDNATIAGVKSSLNDIVLASNPGDVLVMTYSGHGTFVVDENNDEPDGKDEALVLYDGLLVDDDIRKILNGIKDGVKITIISDSCYSGTVTRGFLKSIEIPKNPPRIRYMPPSDEMIRKINSLNLASKNKIFKSTDNEENMREILLSGCKDTELSYDAFFNGKYFGAMTYYATMILEKTPQITYSEFHSQLRKYLPNSKYPQTPQLEGKKENKNRIMFS